MYEKMSPKKDSAVSPAVAVILIVMLTVVMAAVFGLSVLAFGDINTTKIVGVTAKTYSTDDDHGVIAQFWSGKDMDKLVSVKAFIGDIQLVSKDTGESEIYNPVVGGQYYFSTQSGFKTITLGDRVIQLTEYIDVDTSVPQNVNFVGKFSDGTEQIIYSWQLPIPTITVSPGIYVGNEYIKIVGYTNENGWKGHGLLIQTFNDAVVSEYTVNLIESYFLTIKGEDKPTTKNVFLNGPFERVEDDKGNLYLALAVTTDDKITPYNDEPSLGSEITGDITIKYKEKAGGETKSVKLSVIIPPRVNVNPGDEYKGEIVSYTESASKDKDTVYIHLNEKNNRKNGDKLKDRLAFYLNDDGNRKLICHKAGLAYYDNYFNSEAGHPITHEFNLKKYYEEHPNAVLEAYVIGDQTKGNDTFNTVWYLVDSKPLSELI